MIPSTTIGVILLSSLFIGVTLHVHPILASSSSPNSQRPNSQYHHHALQTPSSRRETRAMELLLLGLHRGGENAADDKNADGGPAADCLSDEDLDEYIDFLLAYAEDRAVDTDNPLFNNLNKDSNHSHGNDDILEDELVDETITAATTISSTDLASDTSEDEDAEYDDTAIIDEANVVVDEDTTDDNIEVGVPLENDTEELVIEIDSSENPIDSVEESEFVVEDEIPLQSQEAEQYIISETESDAQIVNEVEEDVEQITHENLEETELEEIGSRKLERMKYKTVMNLSTI